MTPAEISNREHMERVRAVHRRSAYERVVRKIQRYEDVLRAAELGLAVIPADRCRTELAELLLLRVKLEAELLMHGQVFRSRNPDQ